MPRINRALNKNGQPLSKFERRAYHDLPYRQFLSMRWYDYYVRRSCVHVDVWLLEDSRGFFYFVAEYRQAGKALFRRRVWQARRDPFMGDYVGFSDDDMPEAIHGRARVLNSAWGRQNAWLDRFYAKHIQPKLKHGIPLPLKTDRWSIYLHCIDRDAIAACPDTTAGLQNFYTGRADLEPIFGKVRGRPPSPWDKETRSKLRTLDKLLQGPSPEELDRRARLKDNGPLSR